MAFIETEKSVHTNAWSMQNLHSHPHYEIYFLKSGERSFFLSNALFKLNAPIILIIPPHALHKTEGGAFEATIKYVLRPKVIDKIAEMVTEKFNAEISTPTVLLSLEKELKEVNKSINGIMAAIENGIFTKTTKERLLNLETEQSELENKIAVEQARQTKPLQVNEVKKFLTYFAYMKYEKGEEKNEFFNSFINRVILYDDKVIILYNSNDRETKRLSKKQLKDIENAENLEDIRENSLEPKKFKRVALGAEKGI